MSPLIHRRGRNLARAGAVVAGAMLVLSLAAGDPSASAAPAGSLTIVKGSNPGAGTVLTSGGSATDFTLQTPNGAACSGDGPAGYRLQTFIVSSNVNTDTLAFDANGPSPSSSGATVRLPLFSASQPVIDRNPALTTGAVTGLPAFDFAVSGFSTAVFPAGNYTMGIACTRDQPSGKVVDKYWSVGITIAAAPSDSPSGFTWSKTGAGPTPTTTTVGATTTTAATTTTVSGGVTTTVVTDTTAVTDTTDVTDSTDVTDTSLATDTTAVDSGSGFPDNGSGGELVTTGSSPMPTLVWGVLLLVFGRIAILLGRRVRVVNHEGK
ncbi:MAG: hypothetical protein ACOYMR_15410 [Ilumatobacteraceae bacterium]